MLGKLLGKKPLRISRGTREDDVKVDFKETDSEIVVWLHLVCNKNRGRALMKMVIKLNTHFRTFFLCLSTYFPLMKGFAQ